MSTTPINTDGIVAITPSLLRLIDDAILWCDAGGQVLGYSGGAERLLGLASADVVGRNLESLFTVEGKPLRLPAPTLYQAADASPVVVTTTGATPQLLEAWFMPVDDAGDVSFICRLTASSAATEILDQDDAFFPSSHRIEAATRRYSSQLEIMRSASQALTERLDLSYVLQTLLDFMIALVPCQSAEALLLDEQKQLHISANRQPGRPAAELMPSNAIIHENSHMGVNRVLRSRRSYLVNDTRKVRQWPRREDEPEVRSWLGAPLIVGGELIGLCSLSAPQPEAFSMEHMLTVEAVAAQAATAIRNARLFQDTTKRTAELEAIYGLTTILGSAASVEAMLPEFLRILQEHFRNDFASVALVGNIGEHLNVAAWMPKTLKPQVAQIPIPPGLRDAPAAINVFKNTGSDIELQLQDLLPGNAPAPNVMWTALHWQDRLFGVLQIGWQDSHDLNEDEVRLLSALIDVFTAVLARLRFTETLTLEVEQRTQELRRRQQASEGLRYVLGILNSSRPLEEILDYVIAQACWMFDTETGAIYRAQSDVGPFRIGVAKGLPPHVVANQRLAADDAFVGRAIRTRQPAFVADLTEFEQLHGISRTNDVILGSGETPRFRALLAVPMQTATRLYGCLTLYFADSREFKEEEIALASMLADHAALATENARLRQEAEKSGAVAERNRLARELHDAVTQSLFSSSILADVIPKIWRRDPAEGERRLRELASLNRGALAEMRALLLELRPRALTEVDIVILLEGLCAAMQNRAQIPIELVAEKHCPIPGEVRVSLYRIAQEALNNVVQHANATQAVVTLRCETASPHTIVCLDIRDNGRGFLPEHIPGGHLGLDIMQERAEQIEATLTIESAPGAGTLIRVSKMLNQSV